MRKIFYLIFILLFNLSFSQKYTEDQVEKSNDPKVLASFIKANPEHPRTAEFKVKLVQIITKDNNPEAKPEIKPLKKEKLVRDYKREVRSGDVKSSKQTAKLLTNLFNNDPNKLEVVVQITNNSNCNMIVKFSGKDFYQLDIPTKNSNFLEVKKGSYILTTSICDAKYSSAKKIYKDIAINLSN